MRTTIEIPDELRARLIAVAAKRGEKGYSKVVVEAIKKYLDDIESTTQSQRLATLKGTWSSQDADEVKEAVREARSRWTL